MTSVKMPQLGETVIEGTILKWLKHEGDAVALDEPETRLHIPALRRVIQSVFQFSAMIAVLVGL